MDMDGSQIVHLLQREVDNFAKMVHRWTPNSKPKHEKKPKHGRLKNTWRKTVDSGLRLMNLAREKHIVARLRKLTC